MSTSTSKIIEGVFAINKPASISSAEVIRRVQHSFNPSKLFAPWIDEERIRRNHENDRHNRNKKKNKRIDVKIGHGGTLDPMATGVLILGVGKGTKHLQTFLQCTKTYEATVLFGAATDTYDTLGKVLRRGSWRALTREKVDEALNQYRGKIMQRPPLYSALRMDGKRLYEYAREGKEVPREIEKRPVEVQELEIVEWLDGGKHEFELPKEEAEPGSKELAEKVLHFSDFVTSTEESYKNGEEKAEENSGSKRKRAPDDDDEESAVVKKKPNLEQQEADPETLMSGALQPQEEKSEPLPSSAGHSTSGQRGSDTQQSSSSENQKPPAVKLRMTVTSGFYVRSLCHDLGETLGSLACMSSLVRSRQGEFQLGKNVLEHDIIYQGEEVWGPRVTALLDEWDRGREVDTSQSARSAASETNTTQES